MNTPTKEQILEMPEFVKASLSNDENASDYEMVNYFVASGCSEADAQRFVSYRSFFLTNIVMDDGSIYQPMRRTA